MKTISIFLCLFFSLFFSNAFSADMNPYERIISTAHGAEECLTLDDDLRSVSLQKCRNTDHQQWIFASSGAWLFVKNQALGGSNQEMCLFAANQNSVRMEACAGSGGGDFTSKRLWKRNQHLLSNKYIGDLKKANYLQSNENKNLTFGHEEENSAKWTITQPLYEEIISTAHGAEACLTLGNDLRSVTLEKCLDTDHQQWAFTPSGAWLFVKNQALEGSNQEMCLFAANQNSVRMEACAGSGGGDYTSKRLWKRSQNLLSNKYIGDLKKANYLQSNENKNLIFGNKITDAANWNIVKRYGHIRNVEKGQEACLTLSQNNVSVEFSPCSSEARQDWRVSPIMAGYDKLTSRALANEEKEKCLGSDVRMIDCQGSGYTSQRSWKYSRNLIPSPYEAGLIFSNKFRSDSSKKEVLGFSGNIIQMVPSSQSDAVTWHLELPVTPTIPRRPIVGDKKILLLHAKYNDKPETNFGEVQRAVFGNGNDHYSFAHAVHIASSNRLNFTGDAITGLDLGPKPSGCPKTELMNKAINLAREKGLDPGLYDYINLEIPFTSCKWVGLAASPGSWIIGNASGHKPWMWQHEFGHNLGGPHAKSLERCPYYRGVVQVGDECTVTSAGDPSDTLNGGGPRLYPIPYLYYAGWLDDEQFPEVTSNGTYKIAPLFNQKNSSVVKGLHITRRDGSYLTLEFRQPLPGFDNWSSSDPFVNGAIVRIARFSGRSVSNTLVDTTPESSNGMKDAPLAQGHSADDLLSGKRITVTHIDYSGATVEIKDIPR